ncbi:MAG: TIGR03960 family B12-binding radical SAM protein [Candidatus Aminicenantes bacterium]|nr:MAG: TIGR03960 family B12-binding radical SAM protein [Candidatus Aminicenantes bacterium]
MIKEIDLERILKQVQKPGRYLGGEWNEIKKDPQSVKAKIALVFPDIYEVGMSYLGQKILYFVLNNHPSVLAERVFAPWIDFEQKLRVKKIPLFSLENKIPLFRFDIIGFSLLYELNYTNILTILDLGQVPFLSSKRNLDHPLVIAGGSAVFNPEPVADIFDLFLIGDGEEAFLEIIDKYMTLKQELKEKNAVFRELSKIVGVYVPSFYEPYRPDNSLLLAVKPTKNMPSRIKKRVLFPFSKAPFPEKIVVPNIKIIFDRVAVEVARGCPQKCRFCQASSIYFPPRVKNPSFVLEKVLNSLRSTGYEDASLASLSISDYPYLDRIVEILMCELEKHEISLSLSSLRPKGLSSGITKHIIKVRKTGITLVPEAGTDRLRCVINKNFKDKEILDASMNAFYQGWKLLKLYFMVGLPTEKDEDLEGIVSMIKEIIRIGYKILKKAPQINLSVSSFIPKPHTPFQWLEMEEENILKEKHRFLKSRLKKYPFVKFKEHPFKNSILEAVFSKGDRSLTGVLINAWKNGARFDSWGELFDFNIWKAAFESENIDYRIFLSALGSEAVLPWDHLDIGIKKSHLLAELNKALREKPTSSCLSRECAECQSCSLWPLYEKKFAEKVQIFSEDHVLIGKKTENVFRYRASYSKREKARFLSHIDLNSIIQRGMRRAGIPVKHSKGFHPKMMISYLPALPLGMEGKAELLEFKSQYLFEEKEFISKINEFLPSGVKFLGLRRLEDFETSLNKEIKAMVYSVDLNNEEMKNALEAICKEMNLSSSDSKIVKKLVDDFLKDSKDSFIDRIRVDRKTEKLFITLKYTFQKGIRPHEIVEGIFRIKNPVFHMARERILLEKNHFI